MLQIYKMLIALFTSSERRIFFLLMGLIVFSALMETVGVASILPFLAILSDPSAIDTNPYLSTAYTSLGFESHQSFLLTIGICVFTVVVLNLGVKILTLYAMARFSFMRCAALSTRLLSGYLHQPYTWFLNRNSADLGKSLLSGD